MSELGLGIAFVAGIVSFLSPCVLPIIPGFLAYLAGSSVDKAASDRKAIFLNSLFFVLGFAAIFAILGVLLNTVLEAVAYDAQIWLARIGGVVIIFFGLYLTKLLHIPWLDRDHKLVVKHRFQSRYLTSFVFGAAFAVGWTPCVGAALGSILGLAATAPGSALYLLFAYALGLGIPFLVVGLFAAQASAWIRKYAKVMKYVSIVFGVILIGLGVLIFTQQLNRLASFELLNSFLLQ
ncbi:MAG: cytochrome C biogenesis protein [Candidatus Harrisonbacteria bacterium CG10_big_fil_rev_8_21_14_0_10_49_15]|uniref:Cytochrome C biogenesis protein n=1 Tax=Candidatus Harrisonbacteria bacterium CG10_big_fil_rev_8_21_14_0_10_49_15 TaxID=1974587 RepID=A0A2H0UNX0_9BACT|nr:MAG: cytochrome C biogenesis protein [Candidatus Harrisonbacteria bacterium CG10_big_fil_rev_8_21_14_0_10_49_15]